MYFKYNILFFHSIISFKLCNLIGYGIRTPSREILLVNLKENKGFVETHEAIQKASHKSVWYFDSGATSHVTYERKIFEDIDTQCIGTVKLVDDKEIIVKGGLGTVVINVIVQEKYKKKTF